MDIAELLRFAVEMGASDLHLKPAHAPFIRVHGSLRPTSFESLTPIESQTFAAQLMPDHKMREFADTNEADFGYTLPGVGRFRVNAFRQRGNVGLAIRR